MQTRPFGNTGMRVSPLGWGAAEIGYENIPDKTVDALLGVALDQGLNVIDTAECYMDSEEKVGRSLRGKRQQCLLFTKCGHVPPVLPAGLVTRAGRKLWRPISRALRPSLADWDPQLLERSIDESLRRLQTDWIDLIQLHSCSEELLRQGAVIEVLQRARQAGKAPLSGIAAMAPPRSTPYTRANSILYKLPLTLPTSSRSSLPCRWPPSAPWG